MKTKAIILSILLILLSGSFLNAQSEIDTVKVVSYLQKKFNFKASVEILQHKGEGDNATEYVFRVKNHNTKLHKYLKDVYKNKFTKKETHIFNNTNYSKYVIPEHFLQIFVPVYKYQVDYYLYQPCDFMFSFKLTDSYFAPAYMDGTYAYPITEFIKLHLNSIVIGTSFQETENTIELIDGVKKIYRLNHNESLGYFTPLDNIVNLQIIAEDCDGRMTIFKENFED